jgi:hypothetical protein
MLAQTNAASTIEIKTRIDSKQTACLDLCEQKEANALQCVDVVTSELQNLEDYIANIDESLFTNMVGVFTWVYGAACVCVIEGCMCDRGLYACDRGLYV